MMGQPAWQGVIGSVRLRVDVPRSGTIVAEWNSPNGTRQKVCRSIEELERSVLFQIMLSAGETDTSVAQEVADAVARADEAAQIQRAKEDPKPEKQRRTPKVRQHRRSRRAPRRR